MRCKEDKSTTRGIYFFCLITCFSLVGFLPAAADPTRMNAPGKAIIRYHVPQDASVVMKVHTVLGTEVETLVNDDLTAGSYAVEFDGSTLPSRVYFYRISTRNPVEKS